MSPLNHIAVTPESETGSKSSWFDIAPHHLSLNTPSLPPAQIIHVTRHSSLRGTQGRLTSGEGGPANSGRGSASKVKRGEKVHARLSQRVWCPDRGVVSGPAHARGRPSGVCVSPSVSSRQYQAFFLTIVTSSVAYQSWKWSSFLDFFYFMLSVVPMIKDFRLLVFTGPGPALALFPSRFCRTDLINLFSQRPCTVYRDVASEGAKRYLRKPFMLIDLSTLTNREAAGIPGIASHIRKNLRWTTLIDTYQFTVKEKDARGKDNVVTDCLARLFESLPELPQSSASHI
ncbi:hypothetical protein J6590_083739 [Homalodisca vitripennis]|nr:hypothetical protein J6590_083739 [Homalodisca vitripennis]